jgi:hypothetical protein
MHPLHGLELDILFFAFSGIGVFGFIAYVFNRSTIRIRTGRKLGPTYWGHYDCCSKDCDDSLKTIDRKRFQRPSFFHEPSR